MSKKKIKHLVVDRIDIANTLTIGGDNVDLAAELDTLNGLTASAAELNTMTGITSTVAELNILDTVTASAADLNAIDAAPMGATIVVGAEVPNVIPVTIQLTDADGADLATRAAVFAYLSDDANGDSIAATAPSVGVSITADGLLIPVVANKAFWLVSEADGDIGLDIEEAAADTWYLIVVLANGLLVASAAITF